MKLPEALEGGLAGAFALSIMHEILKRNNPSAPHMDELGMEALEKTFDSFGISIPEDKKLFLLTLAGDLIANSVFYSAAGIGKEEQVWVRGLLLGASAGIGAVLLPKPMGLDESQTNRTPETKALTFGLYLIGGLVASAVMDYLAKRHHHQKQ